MNAPQIVTTPAAIRAEGLTKRYGEVLAVDGLTLEIGTGQFFGLLGPNGSGKTTTIHMLATLIQPNAGSAEVAGFDISRSGVSKIEARLSYVDDKALVYLAEVLKVQVQELFPPRTPGNRLYDFMEKLETTRF